ncbi:hypothetical protein EPUL_004123, partial [Erysiphe pulchra]
MAFGFVDDIILVTWGNSARKNCRRLEPAHDRSLTSAKRYGAAFAPEKYQLVHFTRKHKSADHQESIQLNGTLISPRSEVKVLGILVDSRLRWGTQVSQAAQKRHVAFNALSRITSSVWGPSLHNSRLIYTAVVRPTMLYGSQIWDIQKKGNHKETTWRTPWDVDTTKLYDGLKKHEATTLMLLRSEVIGLNAWLTSVKVPGISPQCSCGYQAQTIHHVLFYCPEHTTLRAMMFIQAGTNDINNLLTNKKGCHAAAEMLIPTDRLQQFSVASAIYQEAP